MTSALELFNFSQLARVNLGSWTPYNPVWASSGTAPAINNGTVVGYYAKDGCLVVAKISVNVGTTTTFGTGFYTLTLPPFTAAANGIPANQFAHAGSLLMNNGGSTFYVGGAMIVQSTPTVVNGVINGSGNFWGAANPAAWTASAATQFIITIAYESVS